MITDLLTKIKNLHLGVESTTINTLAGHKKIAEKLECEVYFVHPYSSWERGLNEYTNKLIRQYFPKNKPLNDIKQNAIFEAVNKLNNRPRKKLGYKTPKEVFYQFINQNQKLALGG